jgi:hypothetical protein
MEAWNPVLVLIVAIREIIRIKAELSFLSSRPIDIAYPMLWKDLFADHIWWLA